MNNIHSDKCNLAVNASEYSSMAHTYLRKINKKYTQENIFRYTPTMFYGLCLLQVLGFFNFEIENLSLFVNQFISHI